MGRVKWLKIMSKINFKLPGHSYANDFFRLDNVTWNANQHNVPLPTLGGFRVNLDLAIPDAVGWWCPSLDDTGDGTNTLYDLANGNDGTLINMEAGDWVADTSYGGIRALDFDGSNENIDLPALTWTNTTQGTISLWFKSDSHTVQLRPFAYCDDGVYTVLRINQGGNDEIKAIVTDDVGTSEVFTTAYDVAEWHHVAWTYANSGNLELWVDGTSIGTDVVSTVEVVAGIGRKIGSGRVNNNYFNGLIDDVRIFDSVLDQAEISKLASQRGYDDAINLTGIEAAPHGTVLFLLNEHNASSYQIILSNLSASSSAGNRFQGPNNTDITIRKGSSVYIRYDETFDSGNGAWHIINRY